MSRASSLDETALAHAVARVRAGEPEALQQVVSALKDDVFRLALRMTAHPEDAEDATQEILIKVITHLGGFRAEASVRTWAYRIAVRHLLDRKKSRIDRAFVPIASGLPRSRHIAERRALRPGAGPRFVGQGAAAPVNVRLRLSCQG